MDLYILITFSIFQDSTGVLSYNSHEKLYLFANSTPTVGRLFGSNVSFLNLLMSALLPTSESPVKMTVDKG